MKGYWRIAWNEVGGWERVSIILQDSEAIEFINDHPGCKAEFIQLPPPQPQNIKQATS